MFITDRRQVIFDDVEDVLAIPENFQIASNLFQKFAVFISQLFFVPDLPTGPKSYVKWHLPARQ